MVNSYMILQDKDNKKEKLQKILNDFYQITKIKICVYDENMNEFAFAPEQHCPFCEYVHSSNSGAFHCQKCTNEAFAISKQTMSPYIYNCHLGLIECVSPIINNGIIYGYIMIGQVSDNTSGIIPDNVLKTCKSYSLSIDQIKLLYPSVRFADLKTVQSSISILEACANYILLNDLLSDNLSEVAFCSSFIAEHISQELSVETLCKAMGKSRTELYGFFHINFNQTPATMIKEYRLKEACRLLSSTTLPVYEISNRCGFNDYNYFSKLFHKKYNVSPLAFRKTNKQF